LLRKMKPLRQIEAVERRPHIGLGTTRPSKIFSE